jgi:outer membrane protein TolC
MILFSRPVPLVVSCAIVLFCAFAVEAQDSSGTRSTIPPRARRVELSLGEAIRTALTNNYDLKIASINQTIQRRQEIIEKSLFLPDLFAGTNFDKGRRPTSSVLDIGSQALTGVRDNPTENFSYNAGLRGRSFYGSQYTIRLRQTKLDQPLTAQAGIIGLNPQNTVSVAIELTQPLARGAGEDFNLAGIRIAANNKEISLHELKRTTAALIYQVEVAYWQLSFAWKNYESKIQARDSATRNFENMREERDEKRRSDLDVITAESQLALREVELSESRALLDDSRDGLLLLINFPRDYQMRRGKRFAFQNVQVDPTSEPVLTSVFEQEDPILVRIGALNNAMALRPEYTQVDLELGNKEIEANVASHQRIPSINLVTSWEQLGLDDDYSNSFSSWGTFDFYAFTVGLEFEFGVFSPGGRQLHFQALDEVRQLNLRKKQIESQIIAEVDQSIRNVLSLRGRVRDLQRRVDLQQQILTKEKEKLDFGRTTYYNVTVIENDLIESQALALRAIAEYQASRANYYLATGTLLNERGVQSTVTDDISEY